MTKTPFIYIRTKVFCTIKVVGSTQIILPRNNKLNLNIRIITKYIIIQMHILSTHIDG